MWAHVLPKACSDWDGQSSISVLLYCSLDGVPVKGNIVGGDFYRDPRSTTYFKAGSNGGAAVVGGSTVPEGGKCRPDLQQCRDYTEKKQFARKWIQGYKICWLQVSLGVAAKTLCKGLLSHKSSAAFCRLEVQICCDMCTLCVTHEDASQQKVPQSIALMEQNRCLLIARVA